MIQKTKAQYYTIMLYLTSESLAVEVTKLCLLAHCSMRCVCVLRIVRALGLG